MTFLNGEFQNLYRETGGFHRVFKLTSSISISSMHAFDSCTFLRRYDTSTIILKEFFTIRLEYYDKRKVYLQGMLQSEADRLSNQARFIMEKCDRTLVVENKKRKVMIEELIKRGYDADPVKEWKRKIKANDAEPEANDEDIELEEEVEDVKPGKASAKKPIDPEKAFAQLADVQKFGYLLGMSMWMLTDEKKNELLKQRDTKLSELNVLKAKTPKNLWVEDLDAFIKKLDEVEDRERKEENETFKKLNKSTAPAVKGGRAKASRKSGAMYETKPSEDSTPVSFELTEELLKKYEKATAASKGAGVKKEKVVKSEVGEEIDEFDALVEGGGSGGVVADGVVADGAKPAAKKAPVKKEPAEKKAAVKKEPAAKKKASDGMKQPKLTFKSKATVSVNVELKMDSIGINFFKFSFNRRRRIVMMRKR